MRHGPGSAEARCDSVQREFEPIRSYDIQFQCLDNFSRRDINNGDPCVLSGCRPNFLAVRRNVDGYRVFRYAIRSSSSALER